MTDQRRPDHDAVGQAVPSARVGSTVVELRGFDGKTLALVTPRPFAPGQRIEVALDSPERALVVRGKVVRVRREEARSPALSPDAASDEASSRYAIELSLMSLPRADRGLLDALFAPPASE